MKKEPVEVAWDIYNRFDQELIKTIENWVDKYPERNDLKYLLSYDKFVKSLPKDSPENTFYAEIIFIHDNFVKPYLPWDKINKSLEGVISTGDIRFLVYKLKPIPFEAFLSEDKVSGLTIEKLCKIDKQRKKELSPLIARLEHLQQHPLYKDFYPLAEVIGRFKYDIENYDAVIKLYTILEERFLEKFGLDKNIKKVSSQKHKYWNAVVSAAFNILKNYCHTEIEALRKIAELLKILYPSIWKEDINTIANRIKQKKYRQIPI
jgi:hypothetical protein